MKDRLLLASFAAGVLLLAHATRYQPIAGEGMQPVTVWDRWLHRVCIVSLSMDNKLLCSVDEISALGEATSRKAEVEKLRAAGFSDKEIEEHQSKSAGN